MAGGKKEDIEPHRADITQWTKDGQNCEQIAVALRERGLEISAKTVSRYRVNWGLRQRTEPRTKGRKCSSSSNPALTPYKNADHHGKDPNRRRVANGPTKHEEQDARKAEITARTERGETAEEIAAALQANGITLAKGTSTIWRLQTYWGLIPYDNARARGKYSDAEKARRAARESAPKIKKPRKSKDVVAPSNPVQIQHYPTGLAFGPDRRPIAPRPMMQNAFLANPGAESSHSQMGGEEPHSDMGIYESPYQDAAQAGQMNIAAELMSADMLVDLAASTLQAANKVKEIYLAKQAGHPIAGAMHVPTDDDIATAKRKVREAAAVMHDLALPNVTTSST